MYNLNVGDSFYCDVNEDGLNQLKDWLLYT